ncbi:MAG: hypothetical protein FJ288_06040 [Planctomycetes bacterium]|nr:hypothetical protein [Planctomycetota bacterium]
MRRSESAASCGLCLVLAAVLAACGVEARAADAPWQWLWVYAPCNFQVDKNVDELLALMERAKKAGYNGMLVADHKFGRLQDRPENYYRNLARARRAAEALGIEIIPAVCPVGYSNSILVNNPHLAEGIPVRDCPMLVRGGRAGAADQRDLLAGVGGFEEDRGGRPTGWNYVDPCVTRDASVAHSGAASARLEKFRDAAAHGNGRVTKKLTLAPWRQYRADLWIKTQGLSSPGDVRVAVISAGGRSLNFTNLGVRATQDWTEHHVLFNTLDSTEVNFYAGIWGGRDGTLWLDDVTLREVAGVNMLRREGCPLRVTSDDGRTEYAEGRDFLRWEYPKMGRVPWPGEYEVVHPEPPLVLMPDSRIREGQMLRASFYHTVVIHDGQVCACLTSDEVFRHMEEQVRLIRQHLAPRKYFMSHDEIRVAGHCGLCAAGGRTAGQALAENVRRCTELVRRAEPQAEIFVWSDMFDPNHNARDKYYLVGSTLEGSWEGLDRSVNVAAWYFGKRSESLEFFSRRGHRIIMAGYYDASDVKANVDGWRSAAANFQGVCGMMYTTWRREYKDLEEFARLAAAPR